MQVQQEKLQVNKKILNNDMQQQEQLHNIVQQVEQSTFFLENK